MKPEILPISLLRDFRMILVLRAIHHELSETAFQGLLGAVDEKLELIFLNESFSELEKLENLLAAAICETNFPISDDYRSNKEENPTNNAKSFRKFHAESYKGSSKNFVKTSEDEKIFTAVAELSKHAILPAVSTALNVMIDVIRKINAKSNQIALTEAQNDITDEMGLNTSPTYLINLSISEKARDLGLAG